MRILGIDPGLRKTGWGIIESVGSSLKYVASGTIKTPAKEDTALRLAYIDNELQKIITNFSPVTAAVEETFINSDPQSAIKLGQARGVALVVPARNGLSVGEYAANKVKKTVVGAGHAGKQQIAMMIKVLLPKAGKLGEDEADALAIAICHAHHKPVKERMENIC
tara:strand:+ start:875 stop:1369 length:495 start_codon:yes stop_codon:yes gene_type:complete